MKKVSLKELGDQKVSYQGEEFTAIPIYFGYDFSLGESETVIIIVKSDFTDLAIDAIIQHSLNS